MSNKISPAEVVKDGVNLFWAKKGELFGLIVVTVVVGLVIEAAIGALVSPEEKLTVLDGFFLLSQFVFQLFISLFVLTAISHLSVSSQRGNGALLPTDWPSRLWKVFHRTLLVWLVSTAVGLVAIAPAAGLGWLLITDWDNPDMFAFFMSGTVGFLCIVLASAFLCRLLILIPGGAVKHILSLSTALKMTKEQPWTPFLTYLILFTMLLGFAFVALFVGFLGSFVNIGFYGIGFYEAVVFVLTILFVLAESALFAVAIICNGIWYEKLRLRYEAQQATPATDVDYGQCQD